jgi:hypothetical protein
MKKTLLLASLIVVCGWGCTMFASWKSIPPPGGCDSCHTQAISANWQLAYAPVTLTDETGKYSWQTPDAVMPDDSSPLEQQKVTEERCFRCHKGPDKAHAERQGRYHH